MLWIWFDTPSEKDFVKYTELFIKKNKELYHSLILQDVDSNDKDFLKLIVTDLWETLWILNKYNFNYILITDWDDRQYKIDKVISFKQKTANK